MDDCLTIDMTYQDFTLSAVICGEELKLLDSILPELVREIQIIIDASDDE